MRRRKWRNVIRPEPCAMKQVRSELLVEIVRRLCAALHPREIYLFGSHAYGEPDAHSDVDLLIVVGDAGIHPRELARIGRNSLRGMGFPVDLVVCTEEEVRTWAPVPCNLVHTVVTKGRRIYGAEEGPGGGVAVVGR